MKRGMRRVVWIALLVATMLTMGAMAVVAENTVASSTMIFEGALTDNGDGSFSGTIPMIDEATQGLGDLEAGFDVYARNGAQATYQDGSPYACGAVVDHDAYTTAGGWGSFYDPDCADWYNYQLRLEDGAWYLEYNANVGNDGDTSGASAAPMSGEIDWGLMYAIENGAGAYYDGMGTAASPGYALDNPCTGQNAGPGAWDMDWSWGSEYIPLELPGFDITINSLPGSQWEVVLTPADAPAGAYNNPDYVWTKVWSAPMGSYGRWPDYSASAGKLLWRDGSMNGWIGDYDAYTTELSNVKRFGGDGQVYEASFTPSGDYVFFQDTSTFTFLTVNGVQMEGYDIWRYDIAANTSSVVFDYDAIDPADIEALTSYGTVNDFGFYMSQGGSDTDILLSFRGDSGNMNLALYDIDTGVFTQLTDTDPLAEYDGQYLGSDMSQIVYWHERVPNSGSRGVSVLDTGTGVATVLDVVELDDVYLSARWGKDHSEVIANKGYKNAADGYWAHTDLVMFTNDGGWSGPVDITGAGYGADDGYVYPGSSSAYGPTFGQKGTTIFDGIWVMREIPDVVYVDDDYTSASCDGKAWGYDAFATINEGLDAVKEGGTVNVAAGTYVEQVVIDGKDLTLQGAGDTLTVIEVPASLPVSCDGARGTTYPVLMVRDADVTLDSLKVDGKGMGNNPGNYHFSGITFSNAGGTAQYVYVTGIRETPLAGNQHGVGIGAMNNDGTARSISVLDCTIDDFQKNGIDMRGSNGTLTVNVERCTITGPGTQSTIAGNGICFSYDVDAYVANNTISGLAFYRPDQTTGTAWTAAGIMAYSEVDMVAVDNTLSGVHMGIYYYNSDGEASRNTIGVIKVDKCGKGIAASSDAFVADDNVITFEGSDHALVDNPTAGIVLYTCGATANANVSMEADGNTVTGFDRGIAFDDDEASAPASLIASANRNDLAGNTVGMWSNVCMVDGSANYWGALDGPSGEGAGSGAQASAYVDYSPWLGLVPGSSPMTWGTDDSIQDAVDMAAAGDTVNAMAGTYNENVAIAKNLTLNGAGAASTIVDAGGSGSCIFGQGAQVTITNLTAQNAELCESEAGIGLAMCDSSAIEDCLVSGCGIGIAVIDSDDVDVTRTAVTLCGIGLAADNAAVLGGSVDAGSMGLALTDSTFNQNQEFGGYIAENCDDSVVTACQFNQNGETGLYYWKSEGHAVSGSQMCDNVVDGLHLMGSPDNDVNGCAMTGNANGAEVRTGVIASSGNDLTGNTISGNSAYGVKADENVTWDDYYEHNYVVAHHIVDASDCWWGAASGPGPVGPGSGDAVTENVNYSPWRGDSIGSFSATECEAGLICIEPGLTTAEVQAIIDAAPAGATVKLLADPAGIDCHPGGLTLWVPGMTIVAEPGACIGSGSPAFTVTAPNVTIQGLELVGDSVSAGIVVDGNADNCAILDCDIHDWYNGVKITSDATSFKMVGNWVHDSEGAGLLVNSGVALDGVVTIEGNLFKENKGPGINNESPNAELKAEYNSWGAYAGPAAGDGVAGAVDAEPYTYAEVYMDMQPTEAAETSVTVSEGDTFEVQLKVDAVQMTGLQFLLTYDTDFLVLQGTTWENGFGDNASDQEDPAVDGQEYYATWLGTPVNGQDVAVLTLEFAATDADGSRDGEDGPWTQYFDISHVEAETNAGAPGGVKVFVDNAGYGAPSAPARDISETVDPDDGSVLINGIAQYTGFVDLQGRTNDAGAEIVVSQSSVAMAGGTTVSDGSYTTVYETGEKLVIGQVYDIVIDAELFLPATATGIALDDRPLDSLALCKLLGGDANNDNAIGIDDVSLIGGEYGKTSGFTPNADVNIDGVVNIQDLVLAAGNYTLSASPWTVS